MNHNLDAVITKEQLKVADGSGSNPLYVALYVYEIDGKPLNKVCVFDVESGRSFYGPDGGYAIFAARDASRALATMNLKETESNVDDLTDAQKTTLKDWATKYLGKYPIVGILQ
eukprot:UN03446